MFWTLFSFRRMDGLDTSFPRTMVWTLFSFRRMGHSSDSSQTSKEASLWQSKLLEFSLGHLRDRTWNISGDMGLVSAGRINKDTPPLTTPSHTSKSSAMDISSHIFQIEIHGATQRRFRRGRGPTSYDMRPEAYLYARKMREGRYHRFLARILT